MLTGNGYNLLQTPLMGRGHGQVSSKLAVVVTLVHQSRVALVHHRVSVALVHQSRVALVHHRVRILVRRSDISQTGATTRSSTVLVVGVDVVMSRRATVVRDGGRAGGARVRRHWNGGASVGRQGNGTSACGSGGVVFPVFSWRRKDRHILWCGGKRTVHARRARATGVLVGSSRTGGDVQTVQDGKGIFNRITDTVKGHLKLAAAERTEGITSVVGTVVADIGGEGLGRGRGRARASV